MFDISGFPKACRTGAKNGTSKFDNWSYQMPISTWVVFMNSLIIYIKTDLLFFLTHFHVYVKVLQKLSNVAYRRVNNVVASKFLVYI